MTNVKIIKNNNFILAWRWIQFFFLFPFCHSFVLSYFLLKKTVLIFWFSILIWVIQSFPSSKKKKKSFETANRKPILIQFVTKQNKINRKITVMANRCYQIEFTTIYLHKNLSNWFNFIFRYLLRARIFGSKWWLLFNWNAESVDSKLQCDSLIDKTNGLNIITILC